MKIYNHFKESRVGLVITIINLRMQLMRINIRIWRRRRYSKRLDKQKERLLNSSACLRDHWEFQEERKNKKTSNLEVDKNESTLRSS